MSIRRTRLQKLFQRWGTKYDYATGNFIIEGQLRPRSIARAKLLLEPKTSAAQVDAFLDEYEMQEQDAYIDAVRQTVQSYPQSDDSELRRWLDAVCREGHEESLIVMKNWLWMVRRKLCGLPVTNVKMPVLYGKTQGGKTTAVNLLIQPFRDLAYSPSLYQITDERHWFVFKSKYIGVVDELADYRHSSKEKFKRVLTDSTLYSRPMRTTKLEPIPQNCTFIGTSNLPVSDIFTDTTSAARVWEIRTKDQLDWQTLNRLNYGRIWGCVSEKASAGMTTDQAVRINNLQHTKLRAQSILEQWLEHRGIHSSEPTNPGVGYRKVLIPTQNLVLDLQDFIQVFRLNERNNLSPNQLGQKMPHYGFSRQKHKDTRCWVVWVPESQDKLCLWHDTHMREGNAVISLL